MSFAVLFPGQGSQHADMLPWLEGEAPAAPVLQAMAATLGTGWRQRLGDADFLSSNQVAQVLVTGVSLAAWAAVSAHLAEAPEVVAGYSVGELAAVACAGAFDATSALALAAQRAQAMDAAVQGLATGLLSVSGPNQAARDKILGALRVETAIHIAADHIILAGAATTLDTAERLLTNGGALCKRLPIRVASHSSWMRPAAAAFASSLAGVHWRPLRCAMVANATGTTLRRPDAVREALVRQIDHTVLWGACLETVAERRVDRVIEIGPGRALSGMWARQYPDVPVRALEDFRSAASAAAWLCA